MTDEGRAENTETGRREHYSRSNGSGGAHSVDDILADTLDETVSRMKTSLATIAGDYFRLQRDAAEEKCRDIASALVHSGEVLRSRDHEVLALYLERAGTGIEGLSDHIGGMEPRDLIAEIDWAIEQKPLYFFGGSLAVGFFLGRLFKSSSRRPRPEHDSFPEPREFQGK